MREFATVKYIDFRQGQTEVGYSVLCDCSAVEYSFCRVMFDLTRSKEPRRYLKEWRLMVPNLKSVGQKQS